MKNAIFLLLFAFTAFTIYGQTSIAYITIEKHNRNAVKLYIDQPEEITSDALIAKIKKYGINGKIKNGVTIYRDVILSAISPNKLDIFTRVQERGIGSVVYMAASKGNDNFATPEDTGITNNIIAFLNTFINNTQFRSVGIDLSDQNDNLAQKEKEYQKLLDNQKDAEKKKPENKVRLVQLQNEIDAMKIEIDKLKIDMEIFKNKRKYINQQ